MSKKSNIIIVILVIAVIGLSVQSIKNKFAHKPVENTPSKQDNKSQAPIITNEKISEDNFTGTRPIIKGGSNLATKSQAYIDQTVAGFKKSADEDVPPMRAKFGVDSPTAQYTIDITAEYIKNEKTESIIIIGDTYTGGASDNATYKVFTASRATGKILALGDVVPSSSRTAFTALVKKELLAWRPEGSEESVVFPEYIKDLTFSSFGSWSFDKDNLIIYFDKYTIGPGALGPVAFQVPLSKIKAFLVAGY